MWITANLADAWWKRIMPSDQLSAPAQLHAMPSDQLSAPAHVKSRTCTQAAWTQEHPPKIADTLSQTYAS